MAKMYRTEAFKGPLMRVSYAWQLFKLREQDGDFTPKYGCTLILEKTGDWLAIKGAIQACVLGQWGEKGIEKFKSGLIRNPILAGDGKEARSKETGDLHAGMGPGVDFIRVQANADRKPDVYDAAMKRCSNQRKGYLLLEEDGCPSGSWGYPVLNAFTWHHAQNGDGISFGIEMFHVVKVAEGDEVLGGEGRADPKKFFEAIGGAAASDEGVKPSSAADMFG